MSEASPSNNESIPADDEMALLIGRLVLKAVTQSVRAELTKGQPAKKTRRADPSREDFISMLISDQGQSQVQIEVAGKEKGLSRICCLRMLDECVASKMIHEWPAKAGANGFPKRYAIVSFDERQQIDKTPGSPAYIAAYEKKWGTVAAWHKTITPQPECNATQFNHDAQLSAAGVQQSHQ